MSAPDVVKRREAWRRWKAQYDLEHQLYNTWRNIKSRCLRPSHRQYLSYGGRGIRLYGPWVDDFEAFETWIEANLGPRPGGKTAGGMPEFTLDRIDNDGDYEPGNLRWATNVQQAGNRRSSLRRNLPRGVHMPGKNCIGIQVAGFPDVETAKRAVEAAERIRDVGHKSPSNLEAA